MSKLSIVIPCYRSSKTVRSVVEDTIAEVKKIGYDIEFVLVNDCSPDEGATISVLREIADQYSFVKVVNLGKNAGQHNATMAGLHYATGDFIVSMDDDGQTMPTEIVKMLKKIDEGYDIVYGYYEKGKKKENIFRLMGSAVNHYTVRMLLNKPKWLKASSFWVIRKYIKDAVIQYRHPNVHLQGIFLRVTDNITCIPIEHSERKEGRSGYTLKKLFSLYGNILGFSLTPLYFICIFGMITAISGFIFDVVLIIRKLLNPAIQAGWTSVIGLITFFSGMLLFSVGIVGIYVGRVLLGETDSPQYVVKDTKNID